MIKVSHEVPLCLLEDSLKFNDYQYILPHLLDKYEEYKNFMCDVRETNTYIMMDNSLHELGTPYSEERILYWLEVLQPHEFFVPDFWQDKNKSIVSAKYWIQKQKQFPNTKFIAVVQANDITEALECLQAYKDLGYKKIALSYGAEWYRDVCPLIENNKGEKNYDKSKMLGRVHFVKRLYDIKLITDSDNIHLLGCSLPQEFIYYKELKAIKSIDTSSPILAAVDNIKYESSLDYTRNGLLSKPKTRIDDVMEIEKEKINIDLLNYNIKSFREINSL
jgi:hypothetical protein